MFFTGLRVQCWRNLADIDLGNLAPCVALFGRNRNGKSSLLLAIQMCLNGWCDRTQKSGAGADALIMDGADSAFIEVDIEVPRGEGPTQSESATYTMINVIHRGKKANEFRVVDADGQELYTSRDAFYRAIAVNPDHLAITTQPHLFLLDRQLGDAVLDVVAGAMDESRVLAAAEDHATKAAVRDHIPWLKQFTSKHGFGFSTTVNLEDIGAKAFELRRTLKKWIEEKDIEISAMGTIKRQVDRNGGALGIASLPAIRETLAKLQRTRDSLIEERGRSESARNPESIETELADTQANLAHAQEAMNTVNADLPDAEDKAKTANDLYDTYRRDESAKTQQIQGALNAKATAEKVLAGLTASGGACPTCKRKYTNQLREELIDPAEQVVADCQKRIDELGAEQTQLLTLINEQRAEVKSTMDIHQGLLSSRGKLASEVQAFRSHKNELELARPSGRAVDLITKDFDACEVSIDRAQKALVNLELQEKKEAGKAALENMRAELVHLNEAEAAWNKGEVLRPMLAGRLDPFLEPINRELGVFGFHLTIDIKGKQVEFLLREHVGPARPLRLCSEGERFVAAFAVAVAFAEMGNTPIILDNMNDLDFELKGKFVRRLQEFSRASIWAAAALQNTEDAVTKTAHTLSPVDIFLVVNGEVTPAVPKESAV